MVSSMMSSRFGEGFRQPSDREDIVYRDRGQLGLLMVLALLEGALSGFGPALYVEYALLAMLFGLVASHGVYFGRRLVELAEARKEAGASEKAQMLALRRRRLQRLSYWISMLNILVSAAVLILAAYARLG